MNIEPLNEQIIIKRVEAETTTEFGLILPNSSVSKSNYGNVVAAHCECTQLAIGDKVLFGNNYSEINIEGNDLVVIDEKDILAVIKS